MAKTATILEIGSSKLKALVTSEGVNDTFVVKCMNEVQYEGYFQGQFVDEENFKESLKNLFSEIDYKKRRYNEKVYVGLPAEFTSVTTAQISVTFRKNKKITQLDIDNLFNQAYDKVDIGNKEIITIAPISFTLDDDGIALNDVIGKKATILAADISIIMAEKSVVEKFNNIFFDLDFDRIEYISEILAEAQYVISKEEREDLCLLIDCGHLSTSISFVEGDGILETKTFSIGGGHITGDLSEIFEMNYKDADKFKNQVVLSLKGGMNDKYDFITRKGEYRRISLNEANNAVAYRIEEIGKIVEQSINEIPNDIAPYMSIYIVGSGIISIKGGKNILAKYLGKNISEGLVPLPGKDKPEYTAIFSLANFALKKCK